MAVDSKIPIVVNEFAHSVALIVNDAVAITDADALVWNAKRIDGIAKICGQRIVDRIRVLVRPFEEIDSHCRWIFAIADRVARRLIESVAVVRVSQTPIHIHAYIIVHVASQVTINPLGKICLRESLSSLVDQQVVVKLHIVDLIVGGKRKRLRTNFHSNRLALRLRVNVSFVVENPVVGLVSE